MGDRWVYRAPVRRVLLIFNPISGGGRAAAASVGVARRLESAGFAVDSLPTEPGPADRWLDGPLGECDALVVMGGDGSIRTAALSASRTGVPMCAIPFGTENLFARRFGMTQDLDALIHRLRRGCVRMVDVGTANGDPFLTMCSVGLDAEVVHELAARRSGAITKFAYAQPILRQLFSWRAPELRVKVDGAAWSLPGPGFLVVGCAPEYAARINPASMSVDDDGLLDACFFPCRTAAGAARWVLRCWRGRQERKNCFMHRRGRAISIEGVRGAIRHQMDGDAPRAPQPVVAVQLGVSPRAVPVLVGGST